MDTLSLKDITDFTRVSSIKLDPTGKEFRIRYIPPSPGTVQEFQKISNELYEATEKGDKAAVGLISIRQMNMFISVVCNHIVEPSVTEAIVRDCFPIEIIVKLISVITSDADSYEPRFSSVECLDIEPN